MFGSTLTTVARAAWRIPGSIRGRLWCSWSARETRHPRRSGDLHCPRPLATSDELHTTLGSVLFDDYQVLAGQIDLSQLGCHRLDARMVGPGGKVMESQTGNGHPDYSVKELSGALQIGQQILESLTIASVLVEVVGELVDMSARRGRPHLVGSPRSPSSRNRPPMIVRGEGGSAHNHQSPRLRGVCKVLGWEDGGCCDGEQWDGEERDGEEWDGP